MQLALFLTHNCQFCLLTSDSNFLKTITIPHDRRALPITSDFAASVTRLGDILVLGDNYFYKSSPNK